MSYAFPPDGLFDFGPQYQAWFRNAFPLFSLLETVAIIWYCDRRLAARLCSRWMLVSWLIAITIEFSLLTLFLNIEEKGKDLFPFVLVPIIGGIAVLLHCAWKVREGNRLEQLPVRLHRRWAADGLFIVAVFLLMAPPGPRSQRASRRFECSGNLKQIGFAIRDWNSLHQHLPNSQVQESNAPDRSWRIELLPYLDFQAGYDAYDRSRAWDAEPNRRFANLKFNPYFCPAIPVQQQRDANGRYYTAYAALIGPKTCFPDGKGLTLDQITDGLSNTVLISEACGQQIVWPEPRDIVVSSENIGVNLPGRRKYQSPAVCSSYHLAGAQVLLGDGSVRVVNKKIDPEVLHALTTANGGEIVGEY